MTNQTIAAPLEEAFKTFDRTQLGWAAAGFAAERYAEDPAALAELVAAIKTARVSDLGARGWQDDWGAAGRLLKRVEQQKPMFRKQSWLELERRR